MPLTGQVAIITGASRGIGKALALRMAREGARVVVAGRSEVEREKLPGTIHASVEEIRKAGGEALALRCDIRDPEQVSALAAETLRTYGRIDVLVNNAAATYRSTGLDIPLKRWDLVMDVNVRGTFLCTRAVVPSMLERGSGSILNITSGAGDMEVRRTDDGRLPSLAYGVSGARAFYADAVPPDAPGPEAMVEAALVLVQQTPDGINGWVGTDVQLQAQLEDR
jgi:NAD(P)-dependent dehydrogenase (short-subunit alcohol dehydrogenase family)